jgi:hypothetical protein
MIECSFNGRLGNNMFQIATTINLANKLGVEYSIPYTSWQGHRGIRDVDLSMFSYKFNRNQSKNELLDYNEISFEYTEIPIKDNIRLNGFWQSWKYFEEIRESLCGLYFTPSIDIINKLSKYSISDNSLGISVRRGDYLMLQHNHCVLSIDYYQEVIDKYFSNGIDVIYIFSDDIEWCRQVFGNSVIYVNEDIGTQLFLMSKIHNLILSNSTFAWWGAYLNQNNGLIVAPDPWFGPNLSNNYTNDLYYTDWIKHTHKIVNHNFEINKEMYE